MFEFEEMKAYIKNTREYLCENREELDDSQIKFLEDTIRLMEEDYKVNEDCYNFLSQYHRLSHEEIIHRFESALKSEMDAKLKALEKKGLNTPQSTTAIIDDMTRTLEMIVKNFLVDMEYPEARAIAFAKSYSQVYKMTVIAKLDNDIN
jgi:hypothetical protein